MILQDIILNYESILTPLIELVIIALLLYLQFYLIKRKDTQVLMVIIVVFSLIIGASSIIHFNVPFTPWIQLFFIVVQIWLLIKKIIK